MLDYLTERLDVPVYMEEPTEDLTDYVLIEKVGSSESNHVPTATLAFQSYGSSLYEAALRNLLVKTLVSNSVELDQISAVRLEQRLQLYRHNHEEIPLSGVIRGHIFGGLKNG